MTDLHKLQPDQLKLREPLPWDVLDGHGQLLLRKGYVVNSETQFHELMERGMYVSAEEFRALQKSAPRAAAYDPMYLMEAVQARLAWLLEARPADGTFEEQIRALCSQVTTLVERSADLLLAATQLLEHRNYPVAHSFHVACLAEMLGKRAGWPSAKRTSLIAAALTMNIGMLDLQLTLRNQREPLNARQRQTVNDHPTEAARMLIDCKVMDDEWLRAVLEHHEKPDGTGYPRRVKTPSELALILSTADIFAAKLSPRAYRRPVVGSEATRVMFTRFGQEAGNPWPALLVKEVGIYPPGTLVKLANDEVGVVFKRGQNAKTPQVMALINAKGIPFIQPTLRNTADASFAVAGVLPLGKAIVGLNFEQIWCRKTQHEAAQEA